MNKREEVLARINTVDFHDGRVEEIRLEGGDAFLALKDWRERMISIHFQSVVYFECYEYGEISSAQVRTRSPQIEKAIDAILAGGGKPEGYSDFAFVHLVLGGDGQPVHIVFEDCETRECLPSTR